MTEEQLPIQDDEAREAQLAADRAQANASLPHADLKQYENAGQRQADLNAAEGINTARAAGDLGVTTDEWHRLRSELGRSPNRGDVQQAS